MLDDNREAAVQSPDMNQVVPRSQVVKIGAGLGNSKQQDQFTPAGNLAFTSSCPWKSNRKLWIEPWPFPQVRSLLRRCCLICLQLEYCLFGCPSWASKVSWSQHSWPVLNTLAAVSARWIKWAEGKKHFGVLCTWLFVWEGKKDMRRKTLIPKMEKVAKHLVGFGCEGEESSQTAECSWFRISCWICFRKLFLS